MAAQDRGASSSRGAPLAPAPPLRRLLAWIYTGPLGHLWSTVGDVVSLWVKWGLASARRRVRERYSNR